MKSCDNRLKRLPCAALFRQPIIRCDGTLTVCNYDIGLELALGNVFERPLNDMWYGDEIRQLRLAEISGDNNCLPDKCRCCKPDLTLSKSETIRYLQAEGREDLIRPFLRRIGEKPSILLVNPSVSPKAPYKMAVTLGLGCIAAALRDKYRVKIVNMPFSNIDEHDVIRLVESEGFDVVGITGMTYQAKGGARLAEMLKERNPGIVTVFGGVFATMAVDEVLCRPSTDFVVRGEGEETILELMEWLENPEPNINSMENISGLSWKDSKGTLRHNQDRKLLSMDDLPPIARDMMPSLGFIPDDTAFTDDKKGEVSAMVMFSRGCPSECIFCASPRMWRRSVRYRTVTSMIAEIKHIMARWGVRNFVIDDDSFTVNPDIIMEFCDTVINEQLNIKWRCNTKVNFVSADTFKAMKAAGCIKVTYGVESGSDRILKNVRKHFSVEDVRRALQLNKETDLPAGMLMIVGHPGETMETAQQSLDLVKELNPVEGWDFQVMQPHPGTALRDEINHFGGTILSDDWDDYFSDNVTYLPEGFEPRQFLELARELTGRPVRYLGEKVRLSYSEIKDSGDVVSIPPNRWDDGEWDVDSPFYWEGDQNCRKGYTHALGRNSGFMDYAFESTMSGSELSGISISARVCSQLSDKKSFIKVFINDVEIASNYIPPKDAEGEIITWNLEGRESLSLLPLKRGTNVLRFQVPKHHKNAAGLSIMHRALEARLVEGETPILIKMTRYDKAPWKEVPLLIIDTWTDCDLRCIMCPQSVPGAKKVRGAMTPLMWKGILEELASSPVKLVDAIMPFWNGEALHNPSFLEMIRTARNIEDKYGKRGYSCMVLHTNGNGMNTGIAEEILKSGLFGSITFSVDAAGSDVYSVLRRGGDYERVKSQIEHFIKIRSGLGLQYPKVTLQFLVMKENCNHAEKFLEQWSSVFNEFDSDFEIRADDTPPIKGDAIFFKRLVTMKPEDQPQAESLHREICIKLGIIDEEVERSVNSDEFIPDHHGDNLLHGVDKRRPCIGLWQNLGIRYDGLVSACCRDFNASMAVGDLREQSLLSILNGQALLNMRKAHVEGRFSDIPVCNGCTGQPNGSISDEEIQDWLRYEGLN